MERKRKQEEEEQRQRKEKQEMERVQKEKEQEELKQAVLSAAQKRNENIKDWSSLAAVKELYLYSSGLTRLPDQIGSLTQLTLLNLGYNKLSELP